MNYSEFCEPFYSRAKKESGLKGITSQNGIAEYFLEAALGDNVGNALNYMDDTFRKWFRGEREPQDDLWEKVTKVLNTEELEKNLSLKINEAALPRLLEGFHITVGAEEIPDKYAFVHAIVIQFEAIAEGCGNAEDVVAEKYLEYTSTETFPAYIRNSYDKYSKLKTLLYSSEERPFDEFFVCNEISTEPRLAHFSRRSKIPDEILIKNVTLEALAKKSRFVLLIGMGGIGKSMMMRHLFLEAIKAFPRTGTIPVLVTLREFTSEPGGLFNLIVESVHRFDVTFSASHVNRLMVDGKCQLLLDGLDEIKGSDMEEFQKQLDALIDRYPADQYVMSTRRFSSFVGLSRFSVMAMMPFTGAQALELIDKLEFCPEEPRLKQQFRDKLVNNLFETHWEFVTNPLLLTLMLMNYHRFADVPEKKYLFYEQAYQTLLQRHDADKLAYKRVFRSVTDPSDFTKVFKEFCAKSYRKGDFEFDSQKFGSYFDRLKSVERLNSPMMKIDNFLFDVCHSACLMYEEGQSFHFLHRSFQEYFFADYYSRQDDTTLRKLGAAIDRSDQMVFDDGSAFDMLYDLAPEKVEKFIFLPFLDQIFEEEENAYWRYLKKGYDYWEYTLVDKAVIDRYEPREKYPMYREYNSPSSEILSLILRVRKLQVGFRVDIGGAEVRYPDLIKGKLYGERVGDEKHKPPFIPLLQVPNEIANDPKAFEGTRLKDRIYYDDAGKPVEFGHVYFFDFQKTIDEPENYAEIINLWKKETFVARKNFNEVKKYYAELKDKFDNVDDIDDDDF